MRRLSKAAASEAVLLGRVLVLIVLPVLVAGTGCWSPCDNELISTTLSPDGRVKAVIFVRSCGATTPVVTELSILPADASAPPRGWANVLTISDDPDHPPQRSKEDIDVQLKWTSNRLLTVSFPRDAVIDKRATKIRGVDIQFNAF